MRFPCPFSSHLEKKSSHAFHGIHCLHFFGVNFIRRDPHLAGSHPLTASQSGTDAVEVFRACIVAEVSAWIEWN